MTIIPLVFPSSLITKFLKTGLFKISLNPLFLSTSSSFKVLKLFNLSCRGASELSNRGIKMSYFDQLLEYSQSQQNTPSWYRFSENRDVVTLEENSNLLKIK